MLVTNSGSLYTEVTLTAAGTTQVVSGTTYVLLTHTATNGDGSNSATNDPTGMSTYTSSVLSSTYDPTCWVARLTPVVYSVDTTTDSTNPTLKRTLLTGTTTTASGVPLVNQIIGFKIGASLPGSATGVYYFDSSNYPNPPASPYNYPAIRSVMVSLVGRTNPNLSNPFVNSFDGGHYQIQGVSVVVTPRNSLF